MLQNVRQAGAGAAPAGLPWPVAARQSLGAALVRSAMFADFKAQLGGGTSPRTGVVEVELQAAALLPPAGGYPAETSAPPLPLPTPAWGMRTMGDLFNVIPSGGGSVAYLRDPVAVTATDLVAAGALKPESPLTPELIESPLAKLAHWSGVSNEALEDVDGLSMWIDAILVRGVLDREDAYLAATLTGTAGINPDRVATTGANVADELLAAAMTVQAASRLPVDGVVVAPDVFATLSTAKASTGSTYLSGQPLAAAPSSTLWGYQLVVSGALEAGTAIVGSFRRGAAIYRKRAIRTEMSQDHADFFIRNLVAIRCEVRELLAVYVPLGFIEVTNLGA